MSETREDIAMQRSWEDREIDRLRTENARLRAALMRVGDDYPGSSCQQWCYEQVGIAPMIDHAPNPLHVTIEDASIKRAAAFIALGVEIDGLRTENARLRDELVSMKEQRNALRKLVLEAKGDFWNRNCDWYERAEKALAQKKAPKGLKGRA